MIQFGPAETIEDLQQIIQLQSINVPTAISEAELKTEGFVTVRHTLDLLKQMNTPYPHTVAKSNGKVIAYALCMRKELREHIPTLYPLFEKIDQIIYKAQVLSNFPYFVMGQICIAKAWRGQGLFSQLYAAQKEQMALHYKAVITSVAYTNPRSMRAHHKVGFQNINEYIDESGRWAILLWEY